MSGLSADVEQGVGVDEVALREQVEAALERLSRQLVRPVVTGNGNAAHAGRDEITGQVRFLGQVVAGWAGMPPGSLPANGAGYGSEVVIEDMDRDTRETYTLMAGALIDIDEGQVSLASPVGQALLGTRAGDVVEVTTPQRVRRLRILGVRTLQERIGGGPPGRPAA